MNEMDKIGPSLPGPCCILCVPAVPYAAWPVDWYAYTEGGKNNAISYILAACHHHRNLIKHIFDIYRDLACVCQITFAITHLSKVHASLEPVSSARAWWPLGQTWNAGGSMHGPVEFGPNRLVDINLNIFWIRSAYSFVIQIWTRSYKTDYSPEIGAENCKSIFVQRYPTINIALYLRSL